MQIERSTQKIPRNVRMNQLAEAEKWVITIMENIAFANKVVNNARARYEFIATALNHLHKLEIRMRVFFDLGIIREVGFDAIIRIEADVERQLTGWLNKTYNECQQ